MCVGESSFPLSSLMFMPISGSICGKRRHVFRQTHRNIFSPMRSILLDNSVKYTTETEVLCFTASFWRNFIHYSQTFP